MVYRGSCSHNVIQMYHSHIVYLRNPAIQIPEMDMPDMIRRTPLAVELLTPQVSKYVASTDLAKDALFLVYSDIYIVSPSCKLTQLRDYSSWMEPQEMDDPSCGTHPLPNLPSRTQ